MTWQGQGRLEAKLGRSVRLGDYVVPRAITWTVQGERGAPDIRLEFEVRDGQPVCTEAHVITKPDGRPLRTSDLCGFNIDSMTADVFREYAAPVIHEHRGETEWLLGAKMGERETWHVRKVLEDEIARPRGASEAELREVVAVYRRHPDAPLKAVELRLGYTRRTAARRVAEARKRGLFDETTAATEAPRELSQDEVRQVLRDHGHDIPEA